MNLWWYSSLRYCFIIFNEGHDGQAAQYRRARLGLGFYQAVIVAMTSVPLGCYMVTISYDYRMIFLFSMLIFSWRLPSSSRLLT